jgi:glycosyltransferase involved in cell wall biosynthesis/2-polyprenyl-3-methyl-5-hydroxy-6-metoxy-1,4-benzoquinol methylase
MSQPPNSDTTADVRRRALEVLGANRVAIFIVAFNAEDHIETVLRRIPEWVAEKLEEIYVVDDSSTDHTMSRLASIEWPATYPQLKVFQTPCNQGYGGNQKLGYQYAIRRGVDIVVLLHADGQYAPESLPDILAVYTQDVDAVFGSRFLDPAAARAGGMPAYKRLGNRILSAIQNRLLGTAMSELHCGYRSYRVAALKDIPFERNSDGFTFDSDIIAQFHAAELRVSEVPIPTYYSDKLCRVTGIGYAWNCVMSAVTFRVMQFEILYDPRFDVRVRNRSPYTVKESPTSLHHYVRRLPLEPGSTLIDIGGGNGDAVGSAHAARGVEVTCIDQYATPGVSGVTRHTVDLDEEWHTQFPVRSYDTMVALDVLEHLKAPEVTTDEMFRQLRSGGTLYASTGNVAFVIIRIMLTLGQFNYGRRGILDLTHKRLMTIRSFRRLLTNAGFRVQEIVGFGVPFRDLRPGSIIFAALDTISFAMARIWPALFAYQILAVCHRPDSMVDLAVQTFPAERHLWGMVECDIASADMVHEHAS